MTLCAALALLVTGCSAVRGGGDGTVRPSTAGFGSTPAAPATATVPAPSPSPTISPAATPAQVLAALRGPFGNPALGPSGQRFGYVVDATTGTPLLDHQGTAPIPPASALKLLTARAALRTLGAKGRLATRVVATAAPDATGTVHGDLYLVGGGDETLTVAAHPADPDTATVAGIAAAVRAAGVRRVTGRVLGDASLFTGTGLPPGWNASYITGGSIGPISALSVDGGRYAPSVRPAARVADPALTAAQDLATALRTDGVTVPGTSSTGKASATAFPVASVLGTTVGAMVRQMLTQSDDGIAEDLARVVAARTGLPTDPTGVGQVEMAAAQQLGAKPGSVITYDASGLSRLDRVPLTVLVAALSRAPTDLLAGLAVAGRTGTLAERYHDAASGDAAGKVRAKTGALIGITTLVGLAPTRSGRLLAFGFAGDAVPVREAGEAALDACAAALTRLP